MILLDYLRHKYIRSGERMQVYDDYHSPIGMYKVEVRGWGAYAAVYAGPHVIRRDGIVRNEAGFWTYQLEGE